MKLFSVELIKTIFRTNQKPQMNNLSKIIFISAVLCTSFSSEAQNVSLAPSRLYYKVGLGEYKSQTVTVTNSSTVKQSFNVTFSDFEAPGKEGKSKFMDIGES